MNVWSIATAAMLTVTAAGAVQQAKNSAPPAPTVTVVAVPAQTPAVIKPSVAVVAKPAKIKTTIAKPAKAHKANIARVIEPQAAVVSAPATVATTDADPVWVAQEDDSPKVSASFNKAPASEVLEWLTKNGVSFVTADSELPKGETITLNVKDRPINEVLDALASAMGGHWERRGGMRVFRKGQGMRFFGNEPNAFRFTMPEGGKAWNLAPGAKGWVTDPSKVKVFGKDGDHVFVMPEGMKELRLDMEKMKSLKDLKDFSVIDGKVQKEMEEAMKEAHKGMLRSGEEMKISRKAMEDVKKAMEKARKEHPGAFDGKVFVMPDREGLFKVLPHGDGKNLYEYRVDREGLRNKMRGPFTIGVDGKSFTKFMDSLSNEQREKARRQGYLRAGELSDAQKKLLGVDTRDKNWTITIKKDGQEITVKSGD